jgi:pimeloyl-ACP methyl ester carboxylesterase
LRSHGHEVFAPSLTGLGERAHLVSPQIGLTTHVQDVVNVVLYEDLRDIVLLGLSYGGAVVTGTLDHIGSRVRELVYLDAFVPRAGQSVASLLGRAEPPIFDVGTVWLAPPPPDPQIDDPRGGGVVDSAPSADSAALLLRAGAAISTTRGA